MIVIIHVINDVFLLLQSILHNFTLKKLSLNFHNIIIQILRNFFQNWREVFYVFTEQNSCRSLIFFLTFHIVWIKPNFRFGFAQRCEFELFLERHVLNFKYMHFYGSFKGPSQLVEQLKFLLWVILGREINKTCFQRINHFSFESFRSNCQIIRCGLFLVGLSGLLLFLLLHKVLNFFLRLCQCIFLYESLQMLYFVLSFRIFHQVFLNNFI